MCFRDQARCTSRHIYRSVSYLDMLFIFSILEGFIPAIVILGIFQLVKDPENMEEYEREFINAHEHEWDHCIPTGFDDENSNLLMKLCENYISQKKLAANPPIVDYHHIDFKKVVHHPFLVKVIRCSENFGIIRAPGHHCAYLLKRGKSNPNIGDVMFFFHEKFCYYFRDLTFQEREYLKDMGRLPNETISDVKNRMSLMGSPDNNLPSFRDNEYPDDMHRSLSTLFDEGEDLSTSSESTQATDVKPPLEHQSPSVTKSEFTKADIKSTQHQENVQFTRINNDNVPSTKSYTERTEPDVKPVIDGPSVKPTTSQI